jgi:hypothetical protein
MAQAVEAILGQTIEDAVYWFEVSGRTPKRVSLHAAPVNIAEGLRRELFGKLGSVVLTSATMCTGGSGTGGPPVSSSLQSDKEKIMGEPPMLRSPTSPRAWALDQFESHSQLGSPFDYSSQCHALHRIRPPRAIRHPHASRRPLAKRFCTTSRKPPAAPSCSSPVIQNPLKKPPRASPPRSNPSATPCSSRARNAPRKSVAGTFPLCRPIRVLFGTSSSFWQGH